MTTPPAAVLDAMTAALLDRALGTLRGDIDGPLRSHLEGHARRDAQVAWDGLVSVSDDTYEREEWRCPCGLQVPNHATPNNQPGDQCGEATRHRRVIIITPTEERELTDAELFADDRCRDCGSDNICAECGICQDCDRCWCDEEAGE